MKRRSTLFASPIALGMGATVVAGESVPRVRTLPEGSVGIGGVVKKSHVEIRDGKPVVVIDEFDLREVSLLGARPR